jgi:crotonobetainyl-CoA:carnitine CoA-transferase CaiB-like acyl-CoA transferase
MDSMDRTQTTPFQDLLVVEIAGSVAGGYAGKLFAGFGATVLLIEPPEGDPARAIGERLDGCGTLFAYLHTGKHSVALDLSTATGRTRFDGLLARADVVIESASPGPLQPLTADHPAERLVKLYVSPFGLSGPYRRYRSTQFTDYAAGGQMYVTGEPEREPLQGAGRQPEYAAGTYGLIAALAALRHRYQTGAGQTIDVSHMEAMASLHQWTSVKWTHTGTIERRIGNRYSSAHPITIYPCKDGYIALSAASDLAAERFLSVIGLGHLLADRRFATGLDRLEHWQAFDAELLPWLMAHTVEEIVSLGQAVRVPVGPVPGMLELLQDRHLAARGFWQSVEVAGRTLRYPGPPFRLSRHAWRALPPPELGSGIGDSRGEANHSAGAAIAQRDRRRLSIQQPVAAQPQSAVARGPGSVVASDAVTLGASRSAPTNQSPVTSHLSPTPLALAGVRVLDLSRVWAGPLAGRILGDLGADVIRVEAIWSRGPRAVSDEYAARTGRYPQGKAGERPWNREGMFNKFNRNKRAITLQLDTPAGKALFERLVQVADVVLENYSPRVMPQLGLGYERLSALNPSIVYIGMPGFGWSGPSRDWVALGTMIEPAAGLSSLMGYAGGGPYKSGVAWADPVAALHAAAAVLIALHDREADPEGRGQAIELAQIEGMIDFIGEEVLAAQVRGADAPRRGNRHPAYAPQGCYPCLGPGGPWSAAHRHGRAGDHLQQPASQTSNDRWIAISITGDAEWRALCRLASFDDGLACLRLDERIARHDELDAAIGAWTATQDHIALMQRLQAAGIAAVAVFDARELVENEQLAARGFWVPITHPDAGTFVFPGFPAHLSATPASYRRPAPGLGEHNVEVLGGLLGLGWNELRVLEADGVIASEPPAS